MAAKALTDDDIDLLRKANVPVPESHEELVKLLEEAERDPGRRSLNEAFKEIRKRMAAKHGTSLRV